MNFLVIGTFLVCFLAEYFARKLDVLPGYFVLLPELFAGLTLLVVIGQFLVGRRLQLDSRYLVFLALFLLTIAMGAVAQNVPSGAIISGLRDYIPFLPFLLLGAIYPFTARQIKTQLTVLAVLLVVQIPIAFYQRFFSYADKMHTGDVVTGTIKTSSALSMLMIAGITILVVLYLKRRLSLPLLLIATGFLLVPTTLNETKGTLVLLPIAMLAPLFCIPKAERPLRKLLPLIAVFAVTGAVFVGAYNAMLQYKYPGRTMQQFWLEGGVQEYMYKGSVEGEDRVGRFDSVRFAVRGISETPLRAAFGLGIGNVSPAMMPGFEGDYAHYYDLYEISFTQLSMLLWNVGYMGLVAFGLLFFAIFRDALLLARSGGAMATFAQVWAPLTVIAAMCLFYKPILMINEIVYPFMLYAGVVARSAYGLRREQRARQREREGARRSEYDWREVSNLARQ
jgi:hypothetical protein